MKIKINIIDVNNVFIAILLFSFLSSSYKFYVGKLIIFNSSEPYIHSSFFFLIVSLISNSIIIFFILKFLFNSLEIEIKK